MLYLKPCDCVLQSYNPRGREALLFFGIAEDMEDMPIREGGYSINDSPEFEEGWWKVMNAFADLLDSENAPLRYQLEILLPAREEAENNTRIATLEEDVITARRNLENTLPSDKIGLEAAQKDLEVATRDLKRNLDELASRENSFAFQRAKVLYETGWRMSILEPEEGYLKLDLRGSEGFEEYPTEYPFNEGGEGRYLMDESDINTLAHRLGIGKNEVQEVAHHLTNLTTEALLRQEE